MYLDYTKIKSGQKKQPMLRLRTLAGKELGVIPFVHDLKFSIHYSEISTIEFTVPYQVNGMLNPLYAALSSYKIIYTEDFGIYVLASPVKTSDGVKEEKEVKGYSLEKLFQAKNLFLEEGTYNFWNPVDSKDTILGRVIELDPSWSVGYVAPRLVGCYRTFDQFDSDALSFCYSDAMETYRCAFVFDVYTRKIHVYDANEDAETLPIYLSYQNLVESAEIEELTDDIATKLHVSGSDGLTIYDVNPTGKDYIVNLDYFIHNGDLDVKVGNSTATLADRVRSWQTSIAAQQTYYTGLASARASLTAQKLAGDVDLTTLNGELDDLTNQQSVIIQALALETTSEGKNTQQQKLNEVNAKISSKEAEIEAQKAKISSIQAEIDGYMDTIASINRSLSYEGFFTEEERRVLNHYMIESSVNDETFVATDVGATTSGAVSSVSGTVTISGSDLTRVDIPTTNKTMYVISGGTLKIPNAGITAEVIRGTLEVSGGSYVLTGYLGKTDYSNHNFQTGFITIAGTLSGFSSNISARTQDDVTEYKGTQFSFRTTEAKTYFSVQVSDYQKYSVAMELYDYGKEVLEDCAWPVYEFDVSSANFLYHEKFEPFKNSLELGKAVHLRLGSEGLVNAKIIGVELDFGDISNFKLIFSNRYQRKNGLEKMRDEINTVSRASRSINANKYTYNRAADKVTEVTEIMQQQLVAAVNNIVNKDDQTVLINSSGINIGGKSKYQMRLVDNMIAMTDDGWKTAKLAIGLFATKDVGTQWGVNAEMLAGNLLIGNKLILQNPTDDGYMMFQVDSTGAWLYNSRFVLQDGSTGGLIIVDPKYGIVAGDKLLFDTNGTTVTPEFMDDAGDITYDSEGMPEHANFFLDVSSGNAYFRGKLIAKSGSIGGYTIEDSYLHAGKGRDYVALNGGTSVYSDYAIWAGYSNPTSASCPFWVKKNGDILANSATLNGAKIDNATITRGTISNAAISSGTIDKASITNATIGAASINSANITGTLNAPTLKGNMTSSNGWLVGCGLAVGGVTYNSAKTPISANFFVDSNGNVTIKNGSISWSAVTGTDAIDTRITNAANAAADASNKATSAETIAKQIANGEYSGGTFINKNKIYSPEIYSNSFKVIPATTGNYNGGFSLYSYWGGSLREMMKIYYNNRGSPYVVFGSGCSAYADWSFPYTEFDGNCKFYGDVDFSSAKVTGLDVYARFG